MVKLGIDPIYFASLFAKKIGDRPQFILEANLIFKKNILFASFKHVAFIGKWKNKMWSVPYFTPQII